ncbi:glycosyltransferase family 4 protein [Methylobacterium sp. C25]|uniref:glycosyltransferase family 4 protein n=1 Tax=Methylobacterium sp. C25 TaxID=2721622 RepID=UPI001F2E52B6|nr:glycosyltransferase family 4 protein [Methylobacterium sp. C25]MCE4225057.1 glycosyltransferase family 4 protein [Methylobacterium sp. C25]
MINGPRGAAKGILDAAYRDLGAKPSHGISDASVTEEDEALALVDYVFCPNAMVTAAVQRRGVSSDKIVEASYGWDPARFKGTGKALAPINGLTALFVGSLSVRKGVHLLLRYWSCSRIRGRLILAGAMEPIIREMCASELARDDVVVLDYVDDVGALFRSADVFVFPTLEEGGPQVTYEACGCRLPVITTPMGAGRIARHGCEGFVLDAYDEAGWIEALAMMAGDPDGREAMARSAAAHAEAFQWHKVALRRREQIEALVNPGGLSGGIDPPGIWREADAA